MIAVGTNILVRLLTGDDARQAGRARSLFAAGPIWVAKTVLLETGWVLRNVYGYDQTAILNAFSRLLGLDNVHTEDATSVANVLALMRHGVDLADAMHLSSRPCGAAFATFDESLIRRARRAGAAEVSIVPK